MNNLFLFHIKMLNLRWDLKATRMLPYFDNISTCNNLDENFVLLLLSHAFILAIRVANFLFLALM